MSENKAVKGLEARYNGVRENPRGMVVITAVTAAGILDYVAELEARLAEYSSDKVKVGDRVKIVRDESGMFGFLIGETGEVIEINPEEPAPVVVRLGGLTKARCKYEEIEKADG